MGQFKNVGDPFSALAEECAEVIQVISKKYRFNGDWNEIPEGKSVSRLQELENEMNDLIYQWNRIQGEIMMRQQGFVPIRDFDI
jgi:NTP pyrophosphatase (non-canonical NTP hydrolase)